MNARQNESSYMKRARRNKVRRTKQLIRRLLISAVVLGLVISFGITGIKAQAHSKENQFYKYYTSVTVNKDDTLWKYATEYSLDNDYIDYINEVKRINNMSDDKIISGMRLIIPYYSTEFVE